MCGIQSWDLHRDNTVLVLFSQRPQGAGISRPREQSPASEPLHSLFPLPGTLFPQMTAWLLLLPSSAEGIESLGNPCP